MKGAGLPGATADRQGGGYASHKGGAAPITEAVRTAAHSADTAGAGMAGPGPHEIVIRQECLEGGYIDGRLSARGLDAEQIREAKSKVRAYLDLVLKDKAVDMTDDAYDMLVNMAIHLIEESSKAE